jgi:hypothetical protein
MKMKPTLDVENIADFKQYYEHGYVRLRDTEEVVRIELVRPNTGQVAYVPCFSPNRPANKLVLVDWEQVPRTFLFGKVPSGMCDVLGRLAWRYQHNNRTGSRGYHPDEYRTRYLAGTHLDAGRDSAGWDERCWQDVIATQVYTPRYTAIQLIDPDNEKRAYALNHLYGLGGKRTVTPAGTSVEWLIYRRDVRVGTYDPSKRVATFNQSCGQKYAVPFSRMMGVETRVKQGK